MFLESLEFFFSFPVLLFYFIFRWTENTEKIHNFPSILVFYVYPMKCEHNLA